MDGARNNNRRGAGNSGGGGRGRGRGRGDGGRSGYQNFGSGGRGSNAQRGYRDQSLSQQHFVNRSPAQEYTGGDRQLSQQSWVNRSASQGHLGGNQPAGGPVSGGGGTWTGSHWRQTFTPSPPSVQAQTSLPPSSSSGELDVKSLSISTQKPLSPSESRENLIQPIRRPDQGGILSVRPINLVVNHFPVKFDPNSSIFHYDVDVKPISSNDSKFVKKAVRKSDMRFIRDKLFSDHPDRFPILKTADDSEKNIFSSVSLPTGQFKVEISDGENVKKGSYILTIKFVNELKLLKLEEYLRGYLSYIPRDILQGMDVVMKENPSRHRIRVGKGFYSYDHKSEDDLGVGVAAYRGFQQSLKPTSQGLVLCLDYSVLAFRKPVPVIEFLEEHIPQVKSADDINRNRRLVIDALKGLKVRVIHRPCKQKFTISGLANENTRDSYFDLIDPEGNNHPRRISLVTYFLEKWERDIKYLNIPCLELGKNNKSNKVPMEFCVLVEGQIFPKENMDRDMARLLKIKSLAKPEVRKDTTNEMLRADDGPCGDVTRNFGFGVDVNMTRVTGRIIDPPDLKLGGSESVKVDGLKGQWNLVGRKSFVDAKPIERWALLDFTAGERYKLQESAFINNLRNRCRNLGMRMEEPLLYRLTQMRELSYVDRLENLLRGVVDEASRISQGKLQIIVCVMSRRVDGYKNLKWVSETKIGVLTQCCLSDNANSARDQNLVNLCLKINAKLGGSNFELMRNLPHFGSQDHVMFIGADVNHPAPKNTTCPSIAAVVGTVNWPAANRYAARVSPQAHRKETISNFGSMCLDLVNTYAQLNKVKPNSIVVFRDGVSEGQFEMALNEELNDLKNAIYDDYYRPKITLIVAQKRNQTRLFVENKIDGGASGNVPPGTVVDSKIVHPFDFDFYLCSHYGSLGTSKPTHYYVLWDENSFTSDELQKLIYDMCYTFVRCTKPVSLVPPVYYADLVAFRGRMFQEAMMAAAPTSNRSATTSNPLGSQFDSEFYCLHSQLKNIMFFV